MSVTVTYDAAVSRVEIEADAMTGASTAVVERSRDQVRWTIVRGAVACPVSSGEFTDPLYDYEFVPNAPTYYRVRPDRQLAATDAFGRTVSGGWSTADTGQAWTVSGTASDYSVSTGAGRMSLGSLAASRTATLAVSLAYLDAMVTVTCPVTPTGDNIEAHLRFRSVDGSNYADVRLFIAPAGTVTMGVRQVAAGVETNAGFHPIPGVTATSAIRVQVQAYGNTIRARAWLASGPPPGDDAWITQLTAVTWQTAGAVQLRALAAASLSNVLPVVIAFDDMEVTDLAAIQTGNITANLTAVWFKSPMRPFLNTEVSLGGKDFPIDRPGRGSAEDVLDRVLPVGTSQPQGSARYPLTVRTLTAESGRTLRFLLASGDCVYLHAPPGKVVPSGGVYLLVESCREVLLSAAGELRHWALGVREVAAPGPDVAYALLTWQTVLSAYPDLDSLLAANATWDEVLSLLADPSEVIVD
jgi:hypothetical protein